MKILILHRVPYPRIEYARGIDHHRHDVTYFGKREILATLPADLPCRAIERPGTNSAFEEARDWLQAEPQSFDRVISLSEYELLDAAQLREWLGVPGASLEQVRLVRDKIVMKQAVQGAGLRVPRFLPLVDFVATGGHAPWQKATVLKPHSGASSADVLVFESPGHVFKAVAMQSTGIARLDADIPDIAAYEVEEFVSGPILHFDGLIENGCILVLTASEYVGTCLGYANGRPLGSFHRPLTDQTRHWVQRALNAVQIHNGSFHLEAIESGGELVFLEVGNRVGGADVVATFERATGVHMPSQELRILLGEPTDIPPAALAGGRHWHGWFVYPGHHLGVGAYRGLDGADAFRGDPGVVTWAELAAGTPLRSNVTYSAYEAPLAGIVATLSPRATREWLENLFESVSIQMDEAENLTLRTAA